MRFPRCPDARGDTGNPGSKAPGLSSAPVGAKAPPSAAFLPCSGAAPRIRCAVSRRGRFAEEPQAAEFEMLQNIAGEGPEAVVIAAPVHFAPP